METKLKLKNNNSLKFTNQISTNWLFLQIYNIYVSEAIKA